MLLSEYEGALTGKVRLRFLDGSLQFSGLDIFNFLSGLIDGLLTIWVILVDKGVKRRTYGTTEIPTMKSRVICGAIFRY